MASSRRSRDPLLGRAPRAVVALVVLASAALVSRAQEPAPVLIRGRVQDEHGQPLADLDVTLIRTHRAVDLRKLKWEESEAVLTRARTDAQGFYEIQAADDGSFSSYFLRFYDPKQFDMVRYVPPPDEDITRRFHRGRPLVENRLVREQPDWSKVKEEVARLGEDSPKGQVLRKAGLPEKVEKSGGAGAGMEEWWYYRRGVVYKFEGDTMIGERRFEPVPAPPPVGAEGM